MAFLVLSTFILKAKEVLARVETVTNTYLK